MDCPRNCPDEVRIAIFPDRVKVRNPGILLEGLTLRTSKVSHRRNPLIADLLRRIQLVEAWGRGIPLILDKAPGARFTEVAGTFIASFPRAPAPVVVEPESGVESDMATGQVGRKPESQPESMEMRILRLLTAKPHGKADLSVELGQKAISGHLNQVIRILVANQTIERTIPDKPNSRLQQYRLTPKGSNRLGQ